MTELKNPFCTNLSSHRLVLRPIRETDDQDMFEYSSIPSVTEHLSWNAHVDIKQTQLYINNIINEYKVDRTCFTWAIVVKDNNKLIGVVRVFDISLPNKRIELSYILNPKFQGKGYITEAILSVIRFSTSKVDINRIQAKCTKDNYASEKVMLKLGMKPEGILKEFWINKGIRTDAKIYAMCKQDLLIE